MKIILIVATYIITILASLIATYIDTIWFFDEEKRRRVIEEFEEKMEFEEVLKKFLRVNLREASLFLGGFTLALIIMGIL